MSRPSERRRGEGKGIASRRALRVYRLLLRVLPADFRAKHGPAMEETFTALLARERGAGRRAGFRLWSQIGRAHV